MYGWRWVIFSRLEHVVWVSGYKMGELSQVSKVKTNGTFPYINNRNPVCPSVTLGVTLGGLDFVSPIGNALGDG